MAEEIKRFMGIGLTQQNLPFLKEGRDGEREILGDIRLYYAEKGVSA